jgi:alkanesulfonate monooxygenase SsuD/methylene tetrahydromethanopterin reductase-like flavin-dependent oxidoreductase (luciferase family)
MEITLGLPVAVPGASGKELLDWAVEGERAGFAGLATLDRLVFDSHDPLTTLAAAAAVTERVKLETTVMVGPLRTNTALLAKQVASVDRLSGGRMVLGLGAGARPDDFAASGAALAGRGRRLEDQIAEMRRIWAGERRGIAGAIGPAPTRPEGPPLILGGHAPRAIARAAAVADGWISGGGGPASFEGGASALRAAWQRGGRTGTPHLMALCYFLYGPAHEAETYIQRYYGFVPPLAQAMLAHTAIGEDAVGAAIDGYRSAGCDEIVFVPCSSDLRQVGHLSQVLATAGAGP